MIFYKAETLMSLLQKMNLKSIHCANLTSPYKKGQLILGLSKNIPNRDSKAMIQFDKI